MPARRSVLHDAVNRRVAVNTPEGQTLFVGRLATFDDETYVLDECETIPAPGEKPQPIAGRHYVDRIHGFITELQT